MATSRHTANSGTLELRRRTAKTFRYDRGAAREKRVPGKTRFAEVIVASEVGSGWTPKRSIWFAWTLVIVFHPVGAIRRKIDAYQMITSAMPTLIAAQPQLSATDDQETTA
jgi:hypothetical protein